MSKLNTNEIEWLKNKIADLLQQAEEEGHPEGPTKVVVPGSEAITNLLDFLDKEMAIMGILSAFSVAVVSLFLNAVGSADLDNKKTLFANLWSEGHWYIIVGSIFILGAAGFFYGHRSRLALCYGQLAREREAPNETNKISVLMEKLNREQTWISYHLAFRCLWVGFLAYAFSFLEIAMEASLVSRPPKVYEHLGWYHCGGYYSYSILSLFLLWITRKRLLEDTVRETFSERFPQSWLFQRLNKFTVPRPLRP